MKNASSMDILECSESLTSMSIWYQMTYLWVSKLQNQLNVDIVFGKCVKVRKSFYI